MVVWLCWVCSVVVRCVLCHSVVVGALCGSWAIVWWVHYVVIAWVIVWWVLYVVVGPFCGRSLCGGCTMWWLGHSVVGHCVMGLCVVGALCGGLVIMWWAIV